MENQNIEFNDKPNVAEKDALIKTGYKVAITIRYYDKNNYPFKIEDYQNKFTPTFFIVRNSKLKAKSGYDEIIKKVVYYL